MPPGNAIANITGFTVGQDLRRLLIIPQGQAGIDSAALGRLLEFNANPVIHELEETPVNYGGIRLVRNIYRGWDIEATFGRYQGNLTYLMAAVMGNFNLNGYETYFDLQALIFNTAQPNGIVETYTFTNCVMSQSGTGNFGETSRVEQRLRFQGQQILVNGVAPVNVATLPSGNGGSGQ
jgi:hypothetical protein